MEHPQSYLPLPLIRVASFKQAAATQAKGA